ncbi:MAG: alkaline phosphatase family protein [Candidatus Bathyarchaeota archaeon]|nr:alkaline phosphatase family protein [Candidatus Bathyarchaeota archaeon]
MANRCVVIGIDGATFDIIRPLISEGRLPHISKLIAGGVHGVLQSTIPPSSIPAWPSFLTGMNPGKHGVYDFLKKVPGKYIGALSTSKDLKSPTVYDILGKGGKTSVVINVTGTYPPKVVRGCLISGLLTPQGVNYVYPEILKEELDEMGYKVYTDIGGYVRSEKIYQELLDLEIKRKEIALSLMNIFNWEFFMLTIVGSDTIQHKLWGDKDKIDDYYYEVDKIVGEVLDKVEDDPNIIIMSDHGFGSSENTFYINKWLEEIGLLSTETTDYESTTSYKIRNLRKKESGISETFSKFGMTKRSLRFIKRMPGYNLIKKWMPSLVTKMYSKIPTDTVAIDWENTKAAVASNWLRNIMINMRGREPLGIVEPWEYEILREEIISKLQKLKNPETNEEIIEKVYKREELYSGPYVDDAPDIVLSLKGKYKVSNSLTAEKVFGVNSGNDIKGSHRMDGIFIASGPDIVKGKKIDGANILDVMPTILKLLSVEIPGDLDGRVLSEIIR